MRARPRLHGSDPLGRQHGFAQQELGVLPRVDVVRHHSERQLVPQDLAEGGDGSGLARPDGPAEPDTQGAPTAVGPVRVGTHGGGAVVGMSVIEMHEYGSLFDCGAREGSGGTVVRRVRVGGGCSRSSPRP